MLLIVAHHYVVNSGLLEVMELQPFSGKSLFLYWFGMWGKTGIDCFVLITGYFMCRSSITLRKFLKLLLEVEFYKVVIYLIFVLSGYETFALKGFIKAIVPVLGIGENFVGCFLAFYLFIPFLNILVQHMDKKQHAWLVVLCLCVYTLFGTVPGLYVKMNYVSWFCVLYFIASYIRNYGFCPKVTHAQWGWLTLVSVLVSMASVFGLLCVQPYVSWNPYRLVSDSNAVMAVVTAVCSFMYFKELKLRQSSFVNLLGASTFGVLLIHANSDTMRRWLWRDLLDNVGHYASDYLVLHALLSVLAIFAVCIVIDYLRIRLLERNVFKWLDNRWPLMANH